MSEAPGPKLVQFNQQALIRREAKRFYKQISRPGVRAISYVIEREEGGDRHYNINSSHADDSAAAEAFAKAAAAMRGF